MSARAPGFGVAGGTGDALGGGILNGMAPPAATESAPQPASKSEARSRPRICFTRFCRSIRQSPRRRTSPARCRLHAIIAKDGSIQELQYVSGPPLLMKAAMDAVHEWRISPPCSMASLWKWIPRLMLCFRWAVVRQVPGPLCGPGLLG